MINEENPLALPNEYVLHDRYRIEELLGAGGFGITYKAYDVLNRSFCAIKEYVPLGICVRHSDGVTMRATGTETIGHYDHGKERFMEEAAALLEVADIPNIVRVTDYFEDNGTVYYIMEYLPGKTIRELQYVMPDRKLGFQDALRILYIVGTSLDKVHMRYHMLHRDISPDNIFMTRDGRIKLIDFGSAKHICRQDSREFSVVLKPRFSPPEQYQKGEPQGSYTDVYALASTFYYMICGKMLPDSMERIAGSDYTSACDLVPEMSRQMSSILDKALYLNYRKRYQSVNNFLSELMRAYSVSQEEHTSDEYHNRKDVGPRFYIALYENNKRIKVWNIDPDVTFGVGREIEGNRVVISWHKKISRSHCYIQYDTKRKEYLVKDVSTNGTYYRSGRLQKNKIYAFAAGERLNLANVCTIVLGDTGNGS